MLIIVSFISFALMNLSSGDPAEIMLSSQGSVVTPQLLESVREDMGLNQPFITQNLNRMKNIINGDFATSNASGT